MIKSTSNKKSKLAHKRWSEGAIVYQVYPRSFYDSNDDGVGDIAGVTKKLNYLKDLGVNAIWLSPFYTSPMADFGYDVADYCDVDPIFGKLKDMEDLIHEAHLKDLKIMVDFVPNHSSDEHPWFRQSKASREDPYSDWYIWKDPKGHDKNGKPIAPNNWLDVLSGKPAWEWEPSRQQFYLHSFHIKQPDLNWANPEVRDAIKAAMRFWLDKGVDGFRVDAVHFIGKDPLFKDEPANPHYDPKTDTGYSALQHVNNHGWPQMYAYLNEMASVLKEEKYTHSPRFMVTEAYPDTHEPIEEYLSYYEGMDAEVAAPFNFEGLGLPWEAGPWARFLDRFHKALNDFSPLCVASYAFGNHDQYRIATRLGDKAARSAAVLLLTLPGMSFIYNGDELGMVNGDIPADMVQDPGANGGIGRDPERTPLQWSPEENAGFTGAEKPWLPINPDYKVKNVLSELKDPDSYLNLYRLLGKLRNESVSLRYGGIQVLKSGHPDVLCFMRADDIGMEKHITLVNFSGKPLKFNTKAPLKRLVISSDPNSRLKGSSGGEVEMAANEAAVFEA